jgi:hypothetical protein
VQGIKKLNLPKVGKIWDKRKKVLGGEKACMDSTAILHPTSGELVVSRNLIREVSLEYCKSTLANNVPSEQFYEYIQSKIQKVKVKLSDEDGASTIQTHCSTQKVR